MPLPSQTSSKTKWMDTPTKRVAAAGTTFAYRQLGPATDVPLIMLNRWDAVLDNFDPRIVDGLAATRRVSPRVDHTRFASNPEAKQRKASTAFGSTALGSLLAATQRAALSAAPFTSRAAASESTDFRTPCVISRSTVSLVACKQLF